MSKTSVSLKRKPLKNGQISSANIKDGETRAAIMKLAENDADIQKKIDALTLAVQELQRRS